MLDYVKTLLNQQNIDLVASLRLEECTVKRAYLLEKHGISSGSVIIFAVPYLCETDGKKNISSYAASRDYHSFFATLFGNLIENLKSKYPNNAFVGFSDHSPIDEIEAAARAGLGILGKNRLLITEKYSSYVFLGELITDAVLPTSAGEIKFCINCGKCTKACPMTRDNIPCLSSLTQKKGELTEIEQEMIKKYASAWGCDICQEVCPYTERAIKTGSIYTNIEFFKESRTPHLTSEAIENMSDEEFLARAYSWRGRQTILRNLKILKGEDN